MSDKGGPCLLNDIDFSNLPYYLYIYLALRWKGKLIIVWFWEVVLFLPPFANVSYLRLNVIRIIQERSKQRHFQLVVITHDEDFVELLGRSDHVDEYIQVSKNPE